MQRRINFWTDRVRFNVMRTSILSTISQQFLRTFLIPLKDGKISAARSGTILLRGWNALFLFYRDRSRFIFPTSAYFGHISQGSIAVRPVHKTENSRIIRGIRLSVQGRGGRLFHGGGRDWSVIRRCAFRPLFARVEPEGHFKSDASLFVCGDPDGGAALFPSSRVISRPIFSLCAYLFLAPPLPIFPPAIDDARFLSGWPEKKETLLSILSPNGLPTIAHTFPSPPIITDHWPRFANFLSSLETALSFEMEMERILR